MTKYNPIRNAIADRGSNKRLSDNFMESVMNNVYNLERHRKRNYMIALILFWAVIISGASTVVYKYCGSVFKTAFELNTNRLFDSSSTRLGIMLFIIVTILNGADNLIRRWIKSEKHKG